VGCICGVWDTTTYHHRERWWAERVTPLAERVTPLGARQA